MGYLKYLSPSKGPSYSRTFTHNRHGDLHTTRNDSGLQLNVIEIYRILDCLQKTHERYTVRNTIRDPYVTTLHTYTGNGYIPGLCPGFPVTPYVCLVLRWFYIILYTIYSIILFGWVGSQSPSPSRKTYYTTDSLGTFYLFVIVNSN